MSFAIIISEKGGQERREVFDKNEISIGRVQGNDLLLPKGNVSKRHARIVYRDGRFIVTDLKSTNGSYVNGHRIAQATIVREGDKIYIGDFILKVDAGASASGPLPSPREGSDAPMPAPMRSDSDAGAPRMASSPNEGSAVSHIPLEQDPDDPSLAGIPGVGPQVAAPRPPPIDSRPPRPPPVGGMTQASGSVDRSLPSRSADRPPPPPPPPPVPNAASASRAAPAMPLPGAPPGERAPARPPPAPAPPAPVRPSVSSAPSAGKSAHATALAGLVQRLVDVVDLDDADGDAKSDQKRAGVERVLREQARAMQQEGEISASVSIDDLVRDATREALDIGPFADALADDDVLEVHATRFDQVVFVREAGTVAIDPPFSSDATFRHALLRLASERGLARIERNASSFDVRLADGSQLAAVFPPIAANGTVAVLRKRRRIEGGLDELVRLGAIARPMATFLQSCLAAKSNLLIAGPMGGGTSQVVAALAGAGAADERVIALQDVDDVPLLHGASLLVPDVREGGGRVVRMAASLRPDRLVVGAMTGEIVGHVVDAIGAGIDGVLAVVHAPSLRQALARLAPALVAARPGLDAASARSWIAASFDLVLEVGRVRGGRYRVLRIAEVVGADANEVKTKDIFELTADPAGGEGAFNATGYVPNVAQELRAHGHRIDDSLFRRAR